MRYHADLSIAEVAADKGCPEMPGLECPCCHMSLLARPLRTGKASIRDARDDSVNEKIRRVR